MPRKVIHTSSVVNSYNRLVVYATCDDGTVWMQSGDITWVKLSDIPQDEETTVPTPKPSLVPDTTQLDEFLRVMREYNQNLEKFSKLQQYPFTPVAPAQPLYPTQPNWPNFPIITCNATYTMEIPK